MRKKKRAKRKRSRQGWGLGPHFLPGQVYRFALVSSSLATLSAVSCLTETCEQAPGELELNEAPRPDRFVLGILQFRARPLGSLRNLFRSSPGACSQVTVRQDRAKLFLSKKKNSGKQKQNEIMLVLLFNLL